MYEALNILTGGTMPLLQFDIFSAVICKKVILSKSTFHINELADGRMNNDIYYDANKLIRLRNTFRNILKFEKNSHPNERIFIVRISQQRNIININDLIELALKMNYKIVYPERFDFITQVKIFSNASKIVGPTGAWLANLIFAKENTQVSVLNPLTVYAEKSFSQTLGDIFDIRIKNYFFNSPIVNSFQPIHSDFLVDIDRFSDILSV
jgi:capsular polysaccharide biosynthesis protein